MKNGALFSVRYRPYEIDGVKNKRKKRSQKESRKKIRMKLSGFSSTEPLPYPKFLFLDDMLTMSPKEVSEVALDTHGYKLRLSNSFESGIGEENELSHLQVSKAPGTQWIKYA